MFKRFIQAIIFLLCLNSVPALAQDQTQMQERKFATLQSLNKITAKVSRLEIGVGQTAGFGTLLVTVRACRETPPTEPPEAAVFLEIDEMRSSEKNKRLFSGWMFASSPALSAMEHAVYDIWLISCKNETSN